MWKLITSIEKQIWQAADWLSKYGHSLSSTKLATECCNPKLRNIIRDDMIGCTFVRRGA